MTIFRAGIFFLTAIFLHASLFADAGVLIPSGDEQPDPAKLSLEEMTVDIRIDDGTARVAMKQIYSSHVATVLEGRWTLALPAHATVSNFVVWDDLTRIPGIILERKKAEDIYESIKAQAVDPGLLQQGEGDASEARRSSIFTAKIFPIPGYGYKRVEVDYHEDLPVESLRSRFALPLRPEAYQVQQAHTLHINLEVLSSHAVADFRAVSDLYPLRITEQEPNRIAGSFHGENILLQEDFAVEFELSDPGQDDLEILTFRDPNPKPPPPTAERRPPPDDNPPGYFLARVVLAPLADEETAEKPRTVVALFDTSLSMQWDKLDRSYRALETLLLGLRPVDRFNLLAFDSDVRTFSPQPRLAETAAVESALDWLRGQMISGGTNLEGVLVQGVQQAAQGEGDPYVVVFSDGGATRGHVLNATVAKTFETAVGKLPAERRPRPFVFAVGDDANLPLLTRISQGGIFEHVRSTEPIDFKLEAFLSKIGRLPLTNLSLDVSPSAAFDLVYPLEVSRFAGSVASWAGRFLQPGVEGVFRFSGGAAAQPIERRVPLPDANLDHPHVARVWARARVDALLAKIERDGEDRDSIAEIIRLSKQFNFVTPYTSFLAAPRSLLRPRVIRPGDPILRVRTDESISSVTALFPFGLIKQLRKLDDEDIWQTRFLAPKDTPDGEHDVRLVLRDRQGRVYREKKTYRIISKPPEVRVRLAKQSYRRGEQVELKASASRTTRTLTARMYGVAPVSLRWNDAEGYNTGSFIIPEDLPAGDYRLRLTAEDFAHNIGVEEVDLAVLP